MDAIIFGRLWRFSSDDVEEDKTTVSEVHDGVYLLGEQLYLSTYQRPLFMSSPQPSSTRPYTGRCIFLFLTLSSSSPLPFSRPFLPPRGSLRALSDGSVLLRSTYINGRPKGRSMERRGWQVELRKRWHERSK